MTDEAQARKERSIAILKAEGVPYNDHLPVIETEAESKRRSAEEVVLRAIALAIVAVKGEGMDDEKVADLVERFAIAPSFTPKEEQFIAVPGPSQQERIQFVWRYEGLWILLWSLGFVEQLGRPDQICDVAKSVTTIRDNGREGLIEQAMPRWQAEILDEADLTYRYHWALVDARINGREPPAGLDPGIVFERHYALNWLIGYGDQDWDDISTDT